MEKTADQVGEEGDMELVNHLVGGRKGLWRKQRTKWGRRGIWSSGVGALCILRDYLYNFTIRVNKSFSKLTKIVSFRG